MYCLVNTIYETPIINVTRIIIERRYKNDGIDLLIFVYIAMVLYSIIFVRLLIYDL